LIAAHRDPDSSWAVRAAASVVTLPDWPTRWRYVRMLAFPSSSYVGVRHAGRTARVGHFARRMGRELRSGWGAQR
jgi:hypothetical protein